MKFPKTKGSAELLKEFKFKYRKRRLKGFNPGIDPLSFERTTYMLSSKMGFVKLLSLFQSGVFCEIGDLQDFWRF